MNTTRTVEIIIRDFYEAIRSGRERHPRMPEQDFRSLVLSSAHHGIREGKTRLVEDFNVCKKSGIDLVQLLDVILDTYFQDSSQVKLCDISSPDEIFGG